MSNACFMFSGGMDSLIGSRMVGCSNLVYVRLGHKYESREMKAAKRLSLGMKVNLTILQGPDLGDFEEESAYIPGRNLVLAYMGALVYDTIYMALQKGERDLSDRSVEFCKTSGKALSVAMDRPVKVVTPCADLYKDEMVELYLEQGHPIDWLKWAWSCYRGQHTECGECKACVRRYIALKANGINCDTWFDSNPRKSSAAYYYLEHLDNYDLHRQSLINQYLGE